MSEFIALTDIIADRDCQPRERLDETYIAELQTEDNLPPVDVFGSQAPYYLADGFHRFFAAKTSNKLTIEAVIHSGTKRDAMLYSCGVNATHGKRRTNEDKRRAVLRMLRDDEWAGWSDHEIARQCKVSQPFVSGLRASLITVISDTPQARTYVNKHGTVSTMNTRNIGRTGRTGHNSHLEEALERMKTPSEPMTPEEVEAGYARAWAELMGDGNGNLAAGKLIDHPHAGELNQHYKSLQEILARLTVLQDELQFDESTRQFFAVRYRSVATAIIQWADEFEDNHEQN